MPCSNCGKKNANDPVGLYRMKFVGKPGGVLLKSAPGNYNQGEIAMQPYKMSRTPYWVLVDPPPVLTAPVSTPDDSVFENQVFIPPSLNAEPEQDMTTKAEKVEELSSLPSGPPSSESSVKPTEPPAESAGSAGAKPEIPDYQELFRSVRGIKEKEVHVVNPLEGPKPVDVGGGFPPLPAKKSEQPFVERKVKPGDDMPAELVAELKSLGDGVLGVEGEEKVEPKEEP